MSELPAVNAVSVAVTLAPEPGVLAPDLPEPDELPGVWRIPVRDSDTSEWRWGYVARGENLPDVEWLLCEQHKESLAACPLGDAERAFLRERGLL